MKQYNILLASSSPRRIDLLRKNGFQPLIIKPDVDETLPYDMGMEESVLFLAMKKALYVESLLVGKELESPSLIIAADTIVYSDRIIGKPESREEAYDILAGLNGKTHFVATGVALLEPFTPRRKVFCDCTKVFFKQYSEEDILGYIQTEEPYDKAGGYAIQGEWGKYVEKIEGDFENVMGFPLSRILEEMKTF